MTESKAIELLEYIRETGNGETPYVGCAQNVAIEMAINALEKKPSREEFIARIRHLGWCCYQIAAGQDYNVEPNKDQYESLLQGVKFGLQNLDMTPEQNHENWMKCKIEQGWVYGEVKDFEKKTHPDLVPFDELPKIEADKDIMDAMMNKEANKLYDLFFEKELES